MHDITLLKDYFKSLQLKGIKVSGKHFNKKQMSHFGDLYPEWDNSKNKNEFVYDILFDIESKPSCKICGTPTTLKSFDHGYRSYCCNKCVNIANSQSEIFSKKISVARTTKFNDEYYLNKYKYVSRKDGENFLIHDYCEHGDFWINKNRFKRLLECNGEICEECISSYSNTEFVDIDKYSNEIGFKHAHPGLWKHIVENCEEIEATFSEKRYMFKHGISKRPLCPICKHHECKYISANRGYTQTCIKSSCLLSSSAPEQDVFNIVTSECPDAISRFKIDGEEIDIFIPSLNIGIEYNGLYWHSEKFRNYTWHLNKMTKLRSMGIKMYTIWEDDWRLKREIIISQIFNLIRRSKPVYARNTRIIEINNDTSSLFMQENHIQGSCISSFRYGLLYNDELVAVMTFGKKRMIFHSNDTNEYELLRFCNKKNIRVVGGAGKLFQHFIRAHKPQSITSYASYDISDGNLYKKLGFTQTDKIYPGYWWCKDGEKTHRSKFMKHLIATKDDVNKTAPQIMNERGYYRTWNSGNLKFTWKP